VIVQIVLLDVVFSLDSVITAVGMTNDLPITVLAVMIAIGIMLVSAGAISTFVNHHPTVKMLALAFLLLIGVSLVAESLGQHLPKGYIYFAMAFSVLVESLNLIAQRRRRLPEPVELRPTFVKEGASSGAVARPIVSAPADPPA
jgi:predicted tellurium resistance membrane protein TerC